MFKFVNFGFKNDKIVIKKYQEDGCDIVLYDEKKPMVALLPDGFDIEKEKIGLVYLNVVIPVITTEEEALKVKEKLEQQKKEASKKPDYEEDDVIIDGGTVFEEGVNE